MFSNFFFVSVGLLKAKLLREGKRIQRLKVALQNARFDRNFPREKKYFLRKK